MIKNSYNKAAVFYEHKEKKSETKSIIKEDIRPDCATETFPFIILKPKWNKLSMKLI